MIAFARLDSRQCEPKGFATSTRAHYVSAERAATPVRNIMGKQIEEMLIESTTMELPDTKTIRLKWPNGYDVDFRTGQFITLYFPDTPNYKRAYSLSSCALDRGFYETTVKRDGKMGTRIVDWVKPGDTMWVIPPVGKFLPVYEP